MATSIKELVGLFEKKGWKYEVVEAKDFVRFGFLTQHYVNLDGDSNVSFVAELLDEGRSWRVYAPRLYKYEEGPNGLAMLKACMHATRACLFASWSLDLADGEVGLSVRSILQEAPFSEAHFDRVIDHAFWAVETFHEMIARARDTGELRLPRGDDAPESLVRRIKALSPAARDRVRLGIDAAMTRAAATADAAKVL